MMLFTPILVVRYSLNSFKPFPAIDDQVSPPNTYIIGHYNPSVMIINLVSHTTYVECVNFYTEVVGPATV